MADLPFLGDELRRRLALERDRQLGIDPGAGNDRGYAFNQWLPVSTNKVGSASWVQQGADPKPAVPEVMQGGLLGGADLLDSPRTGKLTPEALGSLLTGSTLGGGLLAPKGSLAAGGSIKAYHGSPHDFDRFSFKDTSGTGEGGAAYGHGLYFAENEGVARSYRNLAGEPIPWSMEHGGQNIWTADPGSIPDTIRKGAIELHARLSPYKNPGDPAIIARTREGLEKTLANYAKADQTGSPFYQEKFPGEYDRYRADTQAALDALNDPKFKVNPGVPSPGKMYEVNINADPQKFLDWDKPLGQQSPSVIDQVNRAARYKIDTLKDDMRGSDVYRSLANYVADRNNAFDSGQKAASLIMGDRGLPGIKYLDAVSRDRGAGTSNYVVFPTQEEIIEILRKYGLAAPSPVVPGAQGAPTPGLLSDQQSEIPIKDRVY